MASKKNKAKDFFPPVPAWGWDNDEQKAKWEDFKSNAEKLWNQFEEMQKAAEKSWKQQWDTFFAQLMDIEQTVVDSLPDEKVSVPGMPVAPVSPKEIAEKEKRSAELAKNVVPNYLEPYRRMLAAGKGSPVGTIRNGSCSNCNMKNSPQTTMEARNGNLVNCDNCSFYLYDPEA